MEQFTNTEELLCYIYLLICLKSCKCSLCLI